jgi:hypothetical protein
VGTLRELQIDIRNSVYLKWPKKVIEPTSLTFFESEKNYIVTILSVGRFVTALQRETVYFEAFFRGFIFCSYFAKIANRSN